MGSPPTPIRAATLAAAAAASTDDTKPAPASADAPTGDVAQPARDAVKDDEIDLAPAKPAVGPARPSVATGGYIAATNIQVTKDVRWAPGTPIPKGMPRAELDALIRAGAVKPDLVVPGDPRDPAEIARKRMRPTGRKLAIGAIKVGKDEYLAPGSVIPEAMVRELPAGTYTEELEPVAE